METKSKSGMAMEHRMTEALSDDDKESRVASCVTMTKQAPAIVAAITCPGYFVFMGLLR
jgi:hypothetical protein